MSSSFQFLYNTINITINNYYCYYYSHSCHHHRLLQDYATQQINVFLWISLISITFLLLTKLAKLFRLWSKGGLIPGPPCPSFYGHVDLISRSNLSDLLSKSHDIYGSVIKLWLGPTQLLVSIKDPEIVKEMLLKAEDKLPLTGRAFRLAFGRSSLFVSSFEKVEKRRNSLEIALNGKLLERANVVPTKIVDCFMERIQNIVAKGGLDCEVVSQHLAFSMLGATLFGDVFLAWSEATFYEELLMRIAKDACFWASYSIIPFWQLGFWKYHNLCAKLKFLTQDIIKQCRYYSSDVSANSSFLSGFDDHLSTSEEPCGNIISLMFHGSLTTAGLIGNILARLVKHPDTQEKIHSEIMMVHKVSEEHGQKDFNKMPFLLATVYECARLLPAGPLLQRCSLKHDLDLQSGVKVPAGAILVVPVQLVQTDDSCWGKDASQFNPYRFLSKGGKISDCDHLPESYILKNPNENAAFLPFGSGARSCIGQKLAILGVATLFASLLEHYEVQLQPGSESDPKPTMNNCIFQLLPSPKIVFEKRNS
ncbi:hypothetical protein LguiA_010773 [Lonicera macranthoides]